MASRVTNAEARNAVVGFGHFTLVALAGRLKCSEPTAKERLAWLIAKGIVEEVGTVHVGGRGKPPKLYRYVERVSDPAQRLMQERRERERKREDEKLRRAAKAAPVALKASPRTTDKDTNSLLDIVEAQGAAVRESGSGHLSVRFDGERATVSLTPSDRRTYHNLRAKLRRMGLRIP